MGDMKVSVAMITYNGASFIEEQLVSILKQTVKPDEVIISDDGSTDGTVEIIKKIIDDYVDSGIYFCLLTNNPKHGIGKNCEWAIRHTSGDIIFVSGQDDIWENKKIEKVLNVYYHYKDAKVVITNANLIDAQGRKYKGYFCNDFISSIDVERGQSKKIERSKYIYRAENPLVSGPVLSFKSSIKNLIIPIPEFVYEDQIIEFIGLAEDSLYYLEEKLTLYRIHNSVCNTQNTSFIKKLKKTINRASGAFSIPMNMYSFGNMMLSYYSCHPHDFEGRDDAISTVNHIIDLGERELSYMRMTRIKGAFCLKRMYNNDMRYRRSGKQAFIISMIYILMYSKKKRNCDIDNALKKYNL